MSLTAADPPPVQLMQMLMARFVSKAISLAAKLGIADLLSDGARPIDDLAKAVGAHPPSLRRLLRALASVGIFAEDEQGRFGNTPLSEPLVSGPISLRAMATLLGERPHELAWAELGYAVKTGASAFDHVHNTRGIEYMERDKEYGATFTEAMTSFASLSVFAILSAFDFADVGTLVDVGGGQGLLIGSILQQNPTQRGILYDLPAVVALAKPVLEQAGATNRCEVIGGDFFHSVPKGADGYVLKHILHDWDDERSMTILKNVHAAARPGAQLFIVDAVIEEGNTAQVGKIMDLEMLVFNGRERTKREWEQLLGACSFELETIVPTPAPPSIIIAKRV